MEAEDAAVQAKAGRKRRLPKGTSDYQAAWILESDDDEGDGRCACVSGKLAMVAGRVGRLRRSRSWFLGHPAVGRKCLLVDSDKAGLWLAISFLNKLTRACSMPRLVLTVIALQASLSIWLAPACVLATCSADNASNATSSCSHVLLQQRL